ncbi:MAG: sigma-70 family RNA polymerase sigma factor [Deferribacteres bacterium]|nr:sigma-70 family RNA polymerase sigma factor [candidate division KSB1 bacterium]MCB9502744.1 sigma-70 family RNA polymerase sigma factor [Deferribacteres bacterium]
MQNQLEQSFIQIIEENKDKIYRICKIYAVLPVEPQDLFQEVVIQVWRSLSTFKGKSKISTWIYKVSLNVCYSSKMKLEKSNNNTVRLESIHFALSENTTDNIQKEKYQALQMCISTLNEIDKSIVILYLEELLYKEIATIMGLTENHIAVKMKRIRKTLLKCITHKLRILR